MTTTPSALNTALAGELLPCKRPAMNWCLEWDGDHVHLADCPANHRPAVALALQAKEDSASLEIDRLKEEIGRLREALEPFVRHANLYRERGDEENCTVHVAMKVGQLRKARAALQTDGENL